MRVLVTGSRTWNDVGLVASVLEKLKGDVTIIHGDAIGADTIADVIATELGFKVQKFPVTKQDWVTYGPGAGHRRNRQMLFEGGPDFVVAFLDTSSTTNGTKGMIELAETYGKRVVLVRKDCSVPCTPVSSDVTSTGKEHSDEKV